MALAKKAFGTWLLAQFFSPRRMPWYKRRSAVRSSPVGLLLSFTPLGRFSLGGLAFFATRQLMARRRYA